MKGTELFTFYKIRKRQFKRMYKMLTNDAKLRLVYNPYSKNPMSISVIGLEVMNDTKLGKRILKEMIKNE